MFGIDIGGSGIKGAPVDLEKGEFATERLRIETPQPATPDAVAQTVKQLIDHFGWKDAFGCTFPAIIQNGVALSAANVDKSWIGTNAEKLFQDATGLPVRVLNDADAAGIAEMAYGAGKGHQGVVIMLTFGTGIGSAIFNNGQLQPNTEFGHVFMSNGKEAEHYTAGKVRKDENLSWKKWGLRVNEYLQYMEALFSPDLFIIGGGVSKRHEKFFEHIDVRAALVPAESRNDAGIIGVALAARALATN